MLFRVSIVSKLQNSVIILQNISWELSTTLPEITKNYPNILRT